MPTTFYRLQMPLPPSIHRLHALGSGTSARLGRLARRPFSGPPSRSGWRDRNKKITTANTCSAPVTYQARSRPLYLLVLTKPTVGSIDSLVL